MRTVADLTKQQLAGLAAAQGFQQAGLPQGSSPTAAAQAQQWMWEEIAKRQLGPDAALGAVPDGDALQVTLDTWRLNFWQQTPSVMTYQLQLTACCASTSISTCDTGSAVVSWHLAGVIGASVGGSHNRPALSGSAGTSPAAASQPCVSTIRGARRQRPDLTSACELAVRCLWEQLPCLTHETAACGDVQTAQEGLGICESSGPMLGTTGQTDEWLSRTFAPDDAGSLLPEGRFRQPTGLVSNPKRRALKCRFVLVKLLNR
jgi:hypothetical protein